MSCLCLSANRNNGSTENPGCFCEHLTHFSHKTVEGTPFERRIRRTFPAKPWKMSAELTAYAPTSDRQLFPGLRFRAVRVQRECPEDKAATGQVRGQPSRDVAARSTCPVIAGDRTFRRCCLLVILSKAKDLPPTDASLRSA